MSEKVWTWLAWKLPKNLAKWAAIRVMAHATHEFPDRTPSEISILDVLQAWK
jgi:hypothetical protein